MIKSIRYPCPTVSDTLVNNIMYNLKTVTTMLEHEIKNKVLTIGNRKGQTVYYAYPKSQQKLTNNMVVERIVRETSLSEGDVKNALKTPKIVFTPKQKMRDAANSVELSIDKSTATTSSSGGSNESGEGTFG